MNRLRFVLTLATALALGLTLSACGLKGPLDPPPAATPAQVQADGKPAAPPPAEAETPPPRKRFFLDWLLD